MPRSVRELIADGQRNEAQYLKRLADERFNEAFQTARFAERWATAVRDGWPYLYDHQNKRAWFRTPPASQPARGQGEGGE